MRVTILPTLPKNRFEGNLSYRSPHQILGILDERYESGLILRDTTYAASSPLYQPYAESYATTDLYVEAPIRSGITGQAGIKNLLDRNYYFTAGYPEEGRNWFVSLRYKF
jgi:iron complex outermembrane receptor protein